MNPLLDLFQDLGILIQYETPMKNSRKNIWRDDWDFNDASRKGSASIAVATRKNRNRKSKKQRAKMGLRGYAIFRAYSDKAEYGAIEVAKAYSSE
ncbi:hypothetical protein F8M41_009664 [Gigaspora margarita]|uniref:Uncharacterized protein n=1 Tax=Gigaspora margarita TaxID=4874 RepID=A0A8H3X4Y8_GIGMA|nr:hypothetical protein F8M41_009664 [Gigaspora margarita]